MTSLKQSSSICASMYVYSHHISILYTGHFKILETPKYFRNPQVFQKMTKHLNQLKMS